jgi:filamentous hemagglutinin
MIQGNAYETAKAGGRHGAFYRLYMQRRTEEISRGIRSLDQRIQEHREKIRDPVHNVAGYTQLDARQQRALLERKWPADIQRLQEQRDILAGILQERGA